MRLSDKAIKHADTAGKKRLKRFDGGGLHLLITETGGKYRRFRYRYQGKGTLSLGCYPHISLKQARQLHRDAQTLLLKANLLVFFYLLITSSFKYFNRNFLIIFCILFQKKFTHYLTNSIFKIV